MWIRLGDDYFNSDQIACIRPIGDGDDQVAVFSPGQSACDEGFLINIGIEEAFRIIQHSRLVELAAMMDSASDDERSTGTES